MGQHGHFQELRNKLPEGLRRSWCLEVHTAPSVPPGSAPQRGLGTEAAQLGALRGQVRQPLAEEEPGHGDVGQVWRAQLWGERWGVRKERSFGAIWSISFEERTQGGLRLLWNFHHIPISIRYWPTKHHQR